MAEGDHQDDPQQQDQECRTNCAQNELLMILAALWRSRLLDWLGLVQSARWMSLRNVNAPLLEPVPTGGCRLSDVCWPELHGSRAATTSLIVW